jgi:hypothetical protein
MQGEMTVDIKQERLAALKGHLMEDVKFGGGLLGHFAMLVELPLQGFHRSCPVPSQPRSANCKVFVATGALAVQPRFVVLGHLKMWFVHDDALGALPTLAARKPSG